MLWRAVADDGFDEIRESWDIRIPPDSSLSAVDRVREEFRAFLQFTIQHVDFHQFMMRENIPGSPRLKWLGQNILPPTLKRLGAQNPAAPKARGPAAGGPNLFFSMLLRCLSLLSLFQHGMCAPPGRP